MTDELRDGHLREALRHAPDAKVQPPEALSAFILKEAQAKARDANGAAPSPIETNPIVAVWNWLTRPALATGLAGVLAATLVGVMWWDRPMDEAMPRRPAPAAAPAPQAVPPPPAASATPAPPPKAAPPSDNTAQAKARAAKAEAAERATTERARSALRKEAPPAEDSVRESEIRRQDPIGDTPRAAEPSAAVSSSAPVVAAAPALVSPAIVSPATADATPPRAARSSSIEQRRQEAQARLGLGSLRAAIAADPTRWTWQRASGAEHDMNDAVYAWLAQLDDAVGNRWRRRTALDAATPLGRELRLMQDSRSLHSLRLTERGVMWESEQAAWEADLPAATLTALQAALDAATR